MDQSSKPREFWISMDCLEGDPSQTYAAYTEPTGCEKVHVIEFSAYEVICEELAQKTNHANALQYSFNSKQKQLKVERQRNEKLVEALKAAKSLGHSSDCMDQDEPLEGDESCECGYSIIEQALAEKAKEQG